MWTVQNPVQAGKNEAVHELTHSKKKLNDHFVTQDLAGLSDSEQFEMDSFHEDIQ